MLSRKFDSDPFFEGHERHMREMEKYFRDPFAAFRESMGIQDSSDRRRDRAHRRDGGQEVAQSRSLFDFGGFDNMFHSMQGVMEDMHKHFEKAAKDPDSHTFSHSSFASYSKTGGSEPKMFQATTSTQQAPGGIRETRRTLRDSESGMEKMAIGRYIGDRGHVIQRHRSHNAGIEENQDFVNLGDDEASEFDREWKERTRQYGGRQIDRGRHDADRDKKRPRALRF